MSDHPPRVAWLVTASTLAARRPAPQVFRADGRLQLIAASPSQPCAPGARYRPAGRARHQRMRASEQPTGSSRRRASAEHSSRHHRRSGPGHPAGGRREVSAGRSRATEPSEPKAIRTRAKRGRRGASRGGRPGSAGLARVQGAQRPKPAVTSRLLMPFFD